MRGKRHAPAVFYPRKDPVPIVQEAGWAPGPVWTDVENLAPPPGFDPRTVQPVASRYTPLRYPVHFLQVHHVKLNLIFMVLDFFLTVYGCNSVTITSNICTLSNSATVISSALIQY